jgi:hypothetical protein
MLLLMTEYISATPEPAKPAKARPSKVWFLVGGLLVVAGIVAGIVLFVRIFTSGLLSVEATIEPDGTPHVVTVDTDGDRFLWEPQYGSADCTVADADTGGTIMLEPVNGTFTREVNADAWQAVATFDPGSGHLSVTCSPAEGPAQIGPALEVEAFVLKIITAIVVPLLLIGLGLAVLIGVGILFASRPRRVD